MRFFGHPVHVLLIHFPIALWPAHWVLHVAAGWLPRGAAGPIAFWLLAAGCALGWLAALAGAADLVAIARENNARRLNLALVHAGVNGTALLAFTGWCAMEAKSYPVIALGPMALAIEAVLLITMFAGNYFGGALVWGAESKS